VNAADWPEPPDLAHDDYISLAGITVRAGGIGSAAREALATETARILSEHGQRAFEYPRESAAIHEAGHIVVHIALGGRVRGARIGCDGTRWIGYTEYRAGEWSVDPAAATADHFIKVARNLYAGLAAEMAFDPDFRQGSSLDEVYMSQWATGEAAHILGHSPQEMFENDVHGFTIHLLQQNERSHRRLTDHLLRRSTLNGLKIAELSRGVRPHSE